MKYDPEAGAAVPRRCDSAHRLTDSDRGCVLPNLPGVAAASCSPTSPCTPSNSSGALHRDAPRTCASRRMSSLLWFFLRDPKAGGAAAWSTVSNIEKGRTFFSFSLGGTSPSSAKKQKRKKIALILQLFVTEFLPHVSVSLLHLSGTCTHEMLP